MGKGLEIEGQKQVLQEMYQEWPWFRELIELLEMIVAKADSTVVENYDKQLIPVAMKRLEGQVEKEDLYSLGETMRNDLAQTEKSLLEVSGQSDLNMGNDVLSRELEVRKPYLDALNV